MNLINRYNPINTLRGFHVANSESIDSARFTTVIDTLSSNILNVDASNINNMVVSRTDILESRITSLEQEIEVLRSASIYAIHFFNDHCDIVLNNGTIQRVFCIDERIRNG